MRNDSRTGLGLILLQPVIHAGGLQPLQTDCRCESHSKSYTVSPTLVNCPAVNIDLVAYTCCIRRAIDQL